MNHLQNFKSSGHLDQFLVQRPSKCQWDVVASKSRLVHWSIALIKKNPNLTDESKEWFLLIIKHKLQSSDDPKRWIEYIELCNNFSLKDSEVWMIRLYLSNLSMQSTFKAWGRLDNQNNLIPSPSMNAMQYDIHNET